MVLPVIGCRADFSIGMIAIPGVLDWAIKRAEADARKFGISADFIRFGIVGTMGFCCDTATVYALRTLVDLYVAGTVAFIVTASFTWAVNRIWTFRHRRHGVMHTQWLKFLATNLIGFTFNRGVFFTMITLSLLCRREPVFAVALGSLAGLGFNYFFSKRFVFAE